MPRQKFWGPRAEEFAAIDKEIRQIMKAAQVEFLALTGADGSEGLAVRVNYSYRRFPCIASAATFAPAGETLKVLSAKKRLLDGSIYPKIATAVCGVQTFEEMDLALDLQRACGAEGRVEWVWDRITDTETELERLKEALSQAVDENETVLAVA